jgi:hypothetical protein
MFTVTGRIVISAGSTGIANTDAGALALLSVIGNAYITDLSADKINAGTLTGRVVQTAASGQRVVIDSSDNTLRFHTATTSDVVLIDDTIEGSRAGIKITDTTNGGMIQIYKSATAFTRLYEYGLNISTSGLSQGIVIVTTGTGAFISCTKTGNEFVVSSAGVVDALGGYKDNGTAGIDSTGAGTVTALAVQGGIVTNITKTAPAANGTYANPKSITIAGGVITAIS